jgi:hypothetical protein
MSKKKKAPAVPDEWTPLEKVCELGYTRERLVELEKQKAIEVRTVGSPPKVEVRRKQS